MNNLEGLTIKELRELADGGLEIEISLDEEAERAIKYQMGWSEITPERLRNLVLDSITHFIKRKEDEEGE